MSKESFPVARRSFLTRLGAGLSAWGVVSQATSAAAQAPAPPRWQPARHSQDDWLDQVSGQHRFVFDTTSFDGFGAAILYANNFFLANQTGYGLNNPDLAVVIVARHFSTVFAFNDTIWSKYGTALSAQIKLQDPATKQAPTVNLFNTTAGAEQLPSRGTTLDSLLKRGVHLAVCQMATRFMATGLAQAAGTSVDAVYAELTSNLLSNAHMVAAGIVAVNRAQERGYTFAAIGA